jgi:branched-chain amino acid transport system substrate-binding protein
MKARVIAAAAALSILAMPALAADKVKIGYITTLSGGGGVIGKHEKDGADLALQDLGGRIGGLEAEIVYGDDQQKPDVGRQLAQEMLKKEKVNFLAGIIWSNVLLSVFQPVMQSNTILVSASAGPHEIAGPMCSPYFFTTAKQNDQPPEAMGKFMTDQKISDVFVLAPNYAAGKDMVEGFKRYFKGNIVSETYTKLDQTDFQTELTQIRAANPKAVFVFYPGSWGIQFIKQYAQSGLRDKIPLYSAASQDETILPAIGAAAEGNYEAGLWGPDLKNPANEKFVAAFRKKYGYIPSIYAAESYDAINLIDSGVKAVKGNLSDTKGMIAAMEKADFQSVRGPFTFNTNHFPIQNFYVFKIAKDADGNYFNKVETAVLQDHRDAYYKDCKMH